MKKIVAILLALLLVTLTGCETTAQKLDNLTDVWTSKVQADEEETMARLENIDLYAEEIALVDMESLYYMKRVTFTENRYSFELDAVQTKALAKEFYRGVFDALYEGRSTLSASYGVDFSAMSKGDFQQFYADMYEMADFEAMIDTFAENAYLYGEAIETGSFNLKGDQIMCTEDGKYVEESLNYKIKGDTLTLTYSNAVEVYTR